MISCAVRHLLERFRSNLPDLHTIAVFLPNSNACQSFRAELLKQLPADCNAAVIPPWTGTLREWVDEFIPLPDRSLTIISEQARRLILINELQQRPTIFKQENKWQVALALLKLFDELNLHNATITESEDEWLDTVQRAYGIDHHHKHLQQEATLVHTLWHAWHDQLHANRLLDSSNAYIAKLRNALTAIPDDFHCYITTTDTLAPCESDFIQQLVKNNCCTLIDKTTVPSNNETSHFIQQAFAYTENTISARATAFKEKPGSKALPFSIFFAQDAELEAQAVDIQIRQWLLDGKQRIGVVSEDRKLSRRLRALLERANIPLQDMAGWSLSTTSAAAVLERWLECIEEDFDYRPLLDFLKSHFFSATVDHEQHLENVYRLERDIVYHENIGHGIDRYQQHLRYRLNKLGWPQSSYQQVSDLLQQLQKCAGPLQKLYKSKYKNSLDKYVEATLNSIEQLGINQSFSDDPAGLKILQTLQHMQQGLAHINPKLEWRDFRTWLGLSLEEQLFSPHTKASPVQLMTLEQARLKQFDGLIIAAADNEHIPGTADESPFFNQSTRQALGLKTWEQKREQRLSLFQYLLTAAPEVLITCKAEEQGEQIPLSPWIEAMENFYTLSTGSSLENTQLAEIVKHHNGVFICDTRQLPEPANQPAPVLTEPLLPDRLSAGAHQRLVNCPYQFFSADGLKLKPSDEISEELKKSDYGQRVHSILQAFHTQVKNCPAPFTEKITASNRQQAIDHLTRLSEQIFRKDLEDNTLHRSWQHRWAKHIPAYINWQMQQQEEWRVKDSELQLESTITDNTSHSTRIFGRIDRVDVSNDQHAIIDYKTGYVAKQDDVDAGEDVQLATYALLDETAGTVAYLSLDEADGGVKTGASISDDALTTLKHDVKNRLQTMIEMTRNRHALTAWGDSGVCAHCNFKGLCRMSSWKK